MAVSDISGLSEEGVHANGSLRLQILGPLRVWRGDVEVSPGPPQQMYFLALLLAREGRPTSAGELIDLIWGDEAPESALNVIHKYVGSLRRLLEPSLPPRDAGSYLLRRGNGYLCAAGPDVLDLAAFRQLTANAEAALTDARRSEALAFYSDALSLWNGSAGTGMRYGPATDSIFSALDNEYIDVSLEAADLAVSLGQPERVLSAVRVAAAMAPLHEPLQAMFVTVLGAAGRQAEALSVFDALRKRLAEELGIAPGPDLQSAFQNVLSQSAALEAVAVPSTVSVAEAEPWPGPDDSRGLVGRREEFSLLRDAVEQACGDGAKIAFVEGEPGAGKTRLLDEVAVVAAELGARVVWGHCLEGQWTPSMWPWVEVVDTLLTSMPPEERAKWARGDLRHLVADQADPPDSVALDSQTQFRLFEQTVAAITETAAKQPLVLMFDDLQWADPSSLQLLEHLATRLPSRTVLVGALRNRVPVVGAPLARMLAAASRVRDHRRIALGPLLPGEIAEIVRRETGQIVGPETALEFHARTAGNPLFVRELARMLTDDETLSEEGVQRSKVPATVRDVVRDRLGTIHLGARELAQIAALIGRNVELSLLGQVANLDIGTCLDRLEPLETLGMLAASDSDPYSYRFTHDLVRQAVSEAMPSGRTASTHLAIADALEAGAVTGGSVAERIAYHLWSAGPLADPARTAAALLRAGRHAMAKTALDEADRQFREAVELARAFSLLELELSALSQMIALAGMRSMYGSFSIDLLERAEHVARSLNREREAVGFLYSRWAAHCQGMQLDLSGPLAQSLAEYGASSTDTVVRTFGAAAWGIHQWHVGNVGGSFRCLSQLSDDVLAKLGDQNGDAVQHDLLLLVMGLSAEVTAFHGDTDQARMMLDNLEAIGDDNRYSITVATTFAARIAALVGDPVWALRAAERGIALDPEFSFVFLGTYQRLARCWALAMSGIDPEGAAAEAERLIEENLLNPPRSCVATWFGALAQMRMAAGALDEAAEALRRADECLERYGQRQAEGLILLLRAKLQHARGKTQSAVELAEQARTLSLSRGAYIFAHQAELFLADIDVTA
ncbi:BTAD domain-containing putative transcriptional regulator [[Kitasatospora] papulosa]|uniref:BTAD domain-containing putative transcriptional regulator n=1 Tax=[Kitasatospora] papulosa TaxID=1464011 RepID=UPI0036962ADD